MVVISSRGRERGSAEGGCPAGRNDQSYGCADSTIPNVELEVRPITALVGYGHNTGGRNRYSGRTHCVGASTGNSNGDTGRGGWGWGQTVGYGVVGADVGAGQSGQQHSPENDTNRQKEKESHEAPLARVGGIILLCPETCKAALV